VAGEAPGAIPADTPKIEKPSTLRSWSLNPSSPPMVNLAWPEIPTISSPSILTCRLALGMSIITFPPASLRNLTVPLNSKTSATLMVILPWNSSTSAGVLKLT